MTLRKALFATVCSLSLAACGTAKEDPAETITGTESSPLAESDADGGITWSCPPEKALICHVPPGNPANAHTLCVGKPAVKAHLKNHDDYLGACSPADAGTVVEDPGAGTDPNSGGEVIDAGPGGMEESGGGAGGGSGEQTPGGDAGNDTTTGGGESGGSGEADAGSEVVIN